MQQELSAVQEGYIQIAMQTWYHVVLRQVFSKLYYLRGVAIRTVE